MKQSNTAIISEVNARHDPLAASEAWQLVAGAHCILVAMGKKILELTPSPAAKAEILQKILGRSNTLRAPALRRGNTFFIGYNDELYRRLTGA